MKPWPCFNQLVLDKLFAILCIMDPGTAAFAIASGCTPYSHVNLGAGFRLFPALLLNWDHGVRPVFFFL